MGDGWANNAVGQYSIHSRMNSCHTLRNSSRVLCDRGEHIRHAELIHEFKLPLFYSVRQTISIITNVNKVEFVCPCVCTIYGVYRPKSSK